MESAHLREGDEIQFSCSVREYFEAPEFEVIQGYGIRRVNGLKVLKAGTGMDIQTFYQLTRHHGNPYAQWLKEKIGTEAG